MGAWLIRCFSLTILSHRSRHFRDAATVTSISLTGQLASLVGAMVGFCAILIRAQEYHLRVWLSGPYKVMATKTSMTVCPSRRTKAAKHS